LLLGSYDPETLDIMKRLQEHIAKTFGSEGVYSLILENLEVFLTDKVDIIAEKWNEDKVTLMVFGRKQVELIDVIDIDIRGDFTVTIENLLHENFQVEFIYKIPILEKLESLGKWCWLIFILRHRELTRGGELIELTYLAPTCNGKIFFLKKEGVPISTMVKEIFEAYDVNLRTYNDEKELLEEAERIILHRKRREQP